jgi:hypothetical protein
MTARHDPELDDVLHDDELRRLAHLLSSATRAEPPLDDAFRSDLRRRLMQQAGVMTERRAPWWGLAFAPPRLAWAGLAVALVLIASVVVYTASQPPGQLTVASSIDGSQGVQLQQPIKVSFNQPMDHASTEAAVQVAPATSLTFSWQDNTLSIQPTSGNLAPNTQYQVTIGPSAKTVANVQLAAPATITFVTQPQPTPTPSPSPRPSPTPGTLLTGEQQLATCGGGTTGFVQWSADSSTVYFVTSSRALEAVPAKGGSVSVIAPDGASSPAIAPAGDRLAYIRGGKIESFNISAGTTSEPATSPTATFVGWAKDKLVWATADGVYTQGSAGSVKLAALPATGTPTVLSVAPDGGHAVYQQDQKFFLLDLGSGQTSALGQAGASFQGWSPDGTQVLYSTSAGIAVSDLQSNTTATLVSGQPSWSVQDSILLGSDTSISQVRPDGTSSVTLANGTYDSPTWAPDGTMFTFVRGAAIWVAAAPPLPAQPGLLDQASSIVDQFMQARLKAQQDQASSLLDGSGKQSYGEGGLKLIISGDPSFTRYYILTREITSGQPDTAKFVVRLVLSRGKHDVSDIEETLTLVRDSATKQFVIDQATSGAHRDLGKGAEVVGVDVAPSVIKVSFDSDLDSSSVSGGVFVLDAKGNKVEATATYSNANRTVTLSGLSLKPEAQYKLVVSTSVRDVLGHNVASEYDLALVGPVPAEDGHRRGGATSSPSPSPTPATPTPTPAG